MATLGLDPAPKLIVNLTAECFEYVDGFASGTAITNTESVLIHPFFRFSLQLIFYVYVAHSFHAFLGRYSIPKLTSDILAGFLLGPTFFENYFRSTADLLFNSVEEGGHRYPNIVMVAIAKLGFVLFSFISGVRMDPNLVRRMGRRTIIFAILMAVFPVVLRMCADVKPTVKPMYPIASIHLTMFMGMMINGQFIGVSHILLLLRISNSKIGHIALASQLITELLRFTYVSFSGFKDEWVLLKKITAIHSFFLFTLFTIFMIFAIRKLILYFIRMTPEGQPVKKLYINMLVAIILASARCSELVGVFATYGPFLIGILVPAGSPVARDVIAATERFTSGTLIPLLMTFCATKFDFMMFIAYPPLIFYITIISFFVKIIGTWALSRLCCEVTAKEGLALSLVLNYKGVLEIATLLSFGNMEYKDIATTSGSLFVLIFSTAMPPLVKWLYDPAKQYVGYEKKSIQHSAVDSDLKIMACAHKQEDAMAAVKLLGFSHATKDSRLFLYGLCLNELVASSTPVTINHQLKQKTATALGSQSQPMLDIFNYFGSQKEETSQVNVFTAVSHVGQMHEDICCMAFNKDASFIILPFHMKWNCKAKKLMPGSNEMRGLNVQVLNRAPCSVGILVDRRGSPGVSSIFVQTTSYAVSVVFIGGEDDREALAYAVRMGGCFRVNLTVARCRLDDSKTSNDSWDEMLDAEALRKAKQQMAESDRFVMKDVSVDDVAGVASVVHELERCSDLIIVGRKHEDDKATLCQLSQWMEFPELGPVGDMLASDDVKSPVSVLIVQQQIMTVENSNLLNGSRVF